MNAAEQLAMTARVVLSLVVVLVLAVLAARLVRRAGLRGPGAGLRVVDRAGLSRESSLAVVEIGGRALLLGVTAHAVTMLTELDPSVLDGPDDGQDQPTEDLPRDGRPADGLPAEGRAPGSGATGAGAAGAGRARIDPSRVRRVCRPTDAPPERSRWHGSVLVPSTWRQAVESLRDATRRRG